MHNDSIVYNAITLEATHYCMAQAMPCFGDYIRDRTLGSVGGRMAGVACDLAGGVSVSLW